jgi:hypothetical protein
MKKILLSLLLAGGVQNSFVMGSCNGGEAAESSSRLEGQVPVKFSDGSVANLDLQRLRELNSGLLQGMLFTENGLSSIREGSTKDKHNLIVMQEFTNLEDFENFEKILKDELSGEIANMVDFCKKAIFLGIDTDDHLKGLFARDKAQFVNLCRALLAENLGFVFNMQRVYPEILHEAIRTKDFDFAKMLIATGADVNARDFAGATSLMIAARNGHTETAQLLIDANADVNASNNLRWTALMMAASNGHTETVKLLINKGADVNVINFGITPLMIAADNGYTNIAQLLIAAGANVNARSNSGWTALMIAARLGHKEIENLLRDAGAIE